MNKFYLFMLDCHMVGSGDRVLINAEAILSISSRQDGEGTQIILYDQVVYIVTETMSEVIAKLKKLRCVTTSSTKQGE